MDSEVRTPDKLSLCVLSGTQGYVYSTFLKQYNPLRDSQRAGQMAKEQPQQQPPAMVDEDFDNLSLFVSGSGSSSLHSFKLSGADSSSTLSGLQGELENAEDIEDTVDSEAQQVCVVLCQLITMYGCHINMLHCLALHRAS